MSIPFSPLSPTFPIAHFSRQETVLQQQIAERDDYTYTHGCLFCRQDVGPTRAEYLTHLSTQHNLQLGRPEKIVFFDKFISVIEEKLEQLVTVVHCFWIVYLR